MPPRPASANRSQRTPPLTGSVDGAFTVIAARLGLAACATVRPCQTPPVIEITSESELRALVGEPLPLVVAKERETWNPGALPSHAQIVKSVQPAQRSLEELGQYYGPSYLTLLYK